MRTASHRRGVASDRGRGWVFATSLAASALALAGLLAWQFHDAPGLQRSSLAQRAKSRGREMSSSAARLADLVEANVRFTRPDIPGLGRAPRRSCTSGAGREWTRSPREIRTELTRSIRERLLGRGYEVRPLVDVVVLDGLDSAD